MDSNLVYKITFLLYLNYLNFILLEKIILFMLKNNYYMAKKSFKNSLFRVSLIIF